MFWIKKTPKENVPETFEKRLSKLESEVKSHSSDIFSLFMDQKMLRDKVLRKIQFKREEEQEEKPKDLYNGMLLKE